MLPNNTHFHDHDSDNEEQLSDNRPLTPEEQRARLRQLIIFGKERGYITYAEINDTLPDDMSDAEQIDNIVNMIQGLGIQVTEEAPDAETLLMSDNSAAVADEDAVAEAEAALSQADSEFDEPRILCVCICVKWGRWNY